jgi:hypothetical protein
VKFSAKVTKLHEGTWFGVPLESGGFAAGLIARKSGRSRLGSLFGYFFGPRLSRLPQLVDVLKLTPSEASLVCQFGYLGLRDGIWPIVGKSPTWLRENWPMPSFVRTQLISGTVFKTTYADDDPGHMISEEAFPPGTIFDLPQDGLYGRGAVEIKLDQLLPKAN